MGEAGAGVQRDEGATGDTLEVREVMRSRTRDEAAAMSRPKWAALNGSPVACSIASRAMRLYVVNLPPAMPCTLLKQSMVPSTVQPRPHFTWK